MRLSRPQLRGRALMASPELAPALLEHLADGVLACDADGITVTFNREAREIFGTPREHVPAAECPEYFGLYIPGEDRLATPEELPLHQALMGEQVRDSVLEVRRAGRPPRLISVSGGPVLARRGRLLGAVVAVRDITEQASLARASQALGALAEQIPAAVVVVRAVAGEIAYVNTAADRMFGYEAGELLGRPFAALDAPIADPVGRGNDVLEALRTHDVWTGDIEHQRKSGSRFWSTVTISPFAHSELGPVWISVHSDITPRRAAADAVQEAAERFRAVFEHAPVGIMLLDDDGHLADVNRRACTITGYSREELVGRTISDLVHPEDVARVSGAWQRTLDGGSPLDPVEIRCVTRRGDVIRVTHRGAAVPGAVGGRLKAVAIVDLAP